MYNFQLLPHNIFGDNMKRIVLIVISLCILFYLVGCNKEEELRLRIISNSNSPYDQEIKLQVKDACEEILIDYQYLDVDILKKELSKHLDSEIYNSITIELKEELFPAKSYEGKFIPSGYYQAIVITIGNGQGSNFWTMLYPEFFNITFEENNEIEYHSYIYDEIVK